MSVHVPWVARQGTNSDEHAEGLTIRVASGASHVVSSWQHPGEPTWDVQVAGEHGVLRAELQPSIALEWNGDAGACCARAR